MPINRWIAAGLAVAAAVIVAVVVYATAGDSTSPRLPANADAATIGVDQQRSDPFNIVFDQSTVRIYDIQLEEAEQAKLDANPTAEQYVQGAVIIDGKRYGPIGVRYKGFFGVLRQCFFTGQNTCDKLAWKLKFNHYEPSLRFHGLKRLNFHQMNSDDAQMREVLTYQVFRDAGVAAPRSVFALLRLNGEPLGLYTLSEDIDDRFIADRFRDGGRGVLYKEIWPGNIERLPAFSETIEGAIRRGPEDPSGLREFSAALTEAEQADAPAAAVFAVLEDYIQDLDGLYGYLAADRLTDNWDGIVAWYCVPVCGNHNYFWYEDALSGEFSLIPWDVENSWRSPSPIRSYYEMPDWDELERSCRLRKVFWDIDARAPHCNAVIHALATQGWERYIEASRELMQDVVTLEQMHERVDAITELIEPHVLADDNGPGEVKWRAAVRLLHEEIDDRWQYIADKIAAWDETGRAPGDG